MKLSLNLCRGMSQAMAVLPGNIYPAKGGRKPGTEFWLVVAVTQSAAHLIGFDAEGNPVSTASYLKSAMQERPIIGLVDLASLTLEEK